MLSALCLVVASLGQIASGEGPSMSSAIAASESAALEFVQGKRMVLKATRPSEIPPDAIVEWFLPIGIEGDEGGYNYDKLAFWGLPLQDKGRYKIGCTFFYNDEEGKLKKKKAEPVYVVILPAGVNPTPPGPIPTPTPPTPTPGDAPFDAPGFAVMIVSHKEDQGTLPVEQRAIFQDSTVKEYLKDKCVPVPGGEGPTDKFARSYDIDLTAQQFEDGGVPDAIKQAFLKTKELAGEDLPFIAISTGRGGYSGPLPGTVEDTMQLLRKYGK